MPLHRHIGKNSEIKSSTGKDKETADLPCSCGSVKL